MELNNRQDPGWCRGECASRGILVATSPRPRLSQLLERARPDSIVGRSRHLYSRGPHAMVDGFRWPLRQRRGSSNRPDQIPWRVAHAASSSAAYTVEKWR